MKYEQTEMFDETMEMAKKKPERSSMIKYTIHGKGSLILE